MSAVGMSFAPLFRKTQYPAERGITESGGAGQGGSDLGVLFRGTGTPAGARSKPRSVKTPFVGGMRGNEGRRPGRFGKILLANPHAFLLQSVCAFSLKFHQPPAQASGW